uniref:TNFR-Cys domain-containing protein n=1 Tax=Astyanax mexicanus TaxID=7994 RepID=W5KGC2_ASTMX
CLYNGAVLAHCELVFISVGNRVYKHCTEFTSTTCVPCSNSSYTPQPNGLLSCLPCTLCDPGWGLRVKTVCTRQSDAVCEPLEGFYCTDHRSGGCIQATEHSKCSPGEYIQRTGTADRDTVCSGCAEGTFSNGSLHTCQPHSQCEDRGLTVIKPGSNSSDAECGNKSSPALIAGVTAGLIVVALVAAAVTGVMFRIKNKTVQNTGKSLLMYLYIHIYCINNVLLYCIVLYCIVLYCIIVLTDYCFCTVLIMYIILYYILY